MNGLEIAGFVCGVVGVWLTLRENVWCFPVGLANVTLSLFLFYEQKLYADSLQQMVYIVLLVYGWFQWKEGEKRSIKLAVSTSSHNSLFQYAFGFVMCTVVLGSILTIYTDASYPWLDSTATALSFVAQWMIAKKKIENWWLWMVVNGMYIGIYLSKNLWLYTLLFFIYLLLAISGYLTWRKQLAKMQV